MRRDIMRSDQRRVVFRQPPFRFRGQLQRERGQVIQKVQRPRLHLFVVPDHRVSPRAFTRHGQDVSTGQVRQRPTRPAHEERARAARIARAGRRRPRVCRRLRPVPSGEEPNRPGRSEPAVTWAGCRPPRLLRSREGGGAQGVHGRRAVERLERGRPPMARTGSGGPAARPDGQPPLVERGSLTSKISPSTYDDGLSRRPCLSRLSVASQPR